MARVKTSKVLDQLDSDAVKAMREALARIAPDADVDHRALAKEFLKRLDKHVSTYTRIDDAYVEKG